MRFPLVILVALTLAACSAGTPGIRNIGVEYRFENVRQAPGTDEWATIKGVLSRSVKVVNGEVVRERSVGDAMIRTYRARVVLPDLAAFEAIHADLEALRATRTSGGRLDYRFDGITAAYRSSFVTAGVSTVISGVTVEGNSVRVFTRPKGEATRATVMRNGIWSARLEGAPEDRWVYGVSEHPSGSLPPRFFRVNVSTLKTDGLDASEFTTWYGSLLPK